MPESSEIEDALRVADARGVDVLEGLRGLLDGGDVQASLVREGGAPHVRGVRTEGDVGQLGDEVRRLGEALELRVAQHPVPHLQLQRGDDRDQVRVAAALAVAVHRTLHVARAGRHGDEAAGHRTVAVVVDVDADKGVGAGLDLAGDVADDGLDERRQRGAVGVAETDDVRARLGGRADARHRVVGVVPVRVEEVLRVVDDPLALTDEKADRVGDHAQVLVAAHVQHLREVQTPGLADDADRGSEDLGEDTQVGVVGGRGRLAPRHAEGDELGVLEPLALHAGEERRLLGIGGGKAALDELQAELVELEGDADLLVDRDRHALLLHAVAQGRVVDLHGAFRRVRRGGHAAPRSPPCRQPPTWSRKCANVASRPSTMSR